MRMSSLPESYGPSTTIRILDSHFASKTTSDQKWTSEEATFENKLRLLVVPHVEQTIKISSLVLAHIPACHQRGDIMLRSRSRRNVLRASKGHPGPLAHQAPARKFDRASESVHRILSVANYTNLKCAFQRQPGLWRGTPLPGTGRTCAGSGASKH